MTGTVTSMTSTSKATMSAGSRSVANSTSTAIKMMKTRPISVVTGNAPSSGLGGPPMVPPLRRGDGRRAIQLHKAAVGPPSDRERASEAAQSIPSPVGTGKG